VAGDKTEKATPKKRADARNEGQVAKSQDLSGAVVTIVGIFTIAVTGPAMASAMAEYMREVLIQIQSPQLVTREGIGPLVSAGGVVLAKCFLPVAGACTVAAFVILAAQVGFKITPKAAMPNIKKLNPVSGAKQVFGPNALVEGIKSILKVVFVAGPALLVVWPVMPQIAAMVGIGPIQLGIETNALIMKIARNVAVAYIVLGIADYVWQRHRTEKQMKMDKNEVKDEAKNMSLPAEVKAAQRRRQFELSRARMMAAVPEADVVVTNPTHFSVALKYGGDMLAPEVVAKGQDLVALRIREIAAEHGVPVVPDPPLARGLHKSVEVGQQIPEDFFQAVAHVLAFVYRTRPMKQVA
jgi:flagellar biosynthetic protein FlhB